MEQEKQTGGKPKPGAYIKTQIPVEYTAYAQTKLGVGADGQPKLGDDGQPLKIAVVPARENGSYWGKVFLNREGHLVQSVGKDQNTAVVHNKDRLELVGQRLQWLDENKRMGGTAVQIHYHGDKAKVYPDSRREREPSDRERLEAYMKTLPAKSRATLEKHLQNVYEQRTKTEPAKEVKGQEKEKASPKKDALER